MTLYVADIASYQSGLVPAQLRPDVSALIVKCTQGAGYVDPDYAAWLDEARACGLLVGVYHYVDGSSPAAQAANLRAHIIDPSLAVMLDEEQVGLPQTLEVADAMAALELHVRLVYLARSYWSAIGSPDMSGPFGHRGIGLVNAAYPSSAAGRPAQLYPGDGASGWNQYGGVSPTLWQFTDAAAEAGQRIDVSAYRGTLAQLTDLFTTTPSGVDMSALDNTDPNWLAAIWRVDAAIKGLPAVADGPTKGEVNAIAAGFAALKAQIAALAAAVAKLSAVTVAPGEDAAIAAAVVADIGTDLKTAG